MSNAFKFNTHHSESDTVTVVLFKIHIEYAADLWDMSVIYEHEVAE